VFTGFTGRVTRKAALMRYYRHELWSPLATMRATFMGEHVTLTDNFAEYEFSAPVEIINDSKKWTEEKDSQNRQSFERRYPS
jgi:hypothetical protein